MCGRGRGRLVWGRSEKDVVVGVGLLTLALLAVSGRVTVSVAPVVTLGAVVLAVTHILHLAVAVGASRPVAITAVVVALTAIVAAGRGSIALATGRSATATRSALAATAVSTTLATLTALRALATGAVSARVEAPRCGGRCSCPLHLIC